jgi:NIPSNAP
MQQASRRQFARVLAGLAAARAFAEPRGVALDAFVAAHLPRRLVVHNIDPRAAVFELRVYGSHPRAMPAILERHGIRPALREHSAIGTAYLIPFESLEARQRAWDAFNADPDWHLLRAVSQVNVKEISLYRVAVGKPLAVHGSAY